ncbi:MAG: hybrid sensor histidine kinase/response regulator [Myxococcales bacterium]|nr:hybrid sensor histidine kinase/response regulator [Myxococcales bacterium]MDD9971851.1 hybrid sensor histidine kinase/response regulator [Myxococcales bacterium]
MATVLHIEDDAASRLLVSKVLTAAGHQVVDADSGLEGIRLAAAKRPDIVLVDINIPDLDGYEVTLRLRGMRELAGTPIVAITAEGDKEQSLAVGADGFVQKPIDTRKFPELVARFLAGHTERSVDHTGEILRIRSQKIVERLEAKVIALSEANRQLEESVRLRQEFFQNMSHEFATPMTPVVGYLKMLLDEEAGPLTPLQRKCLESIRTSTAKLRSLVDTLLDVSHLETGRLQLFERNYDFATVARQALEEAQARFAEAGITVVSELPNDPMDARGDPDKLRRAMVHILDNAAKFTPRGSEVAVGMEVVPARAGRVDGYRFIVMDGGPGISGADRERIFQPFFQVDGSRTRAYGGVGLGLAYARHVADAMGGEIAIDSPPTSEVAGRLLSGTAISIRVARRAMLGDA